MKKVKAFKNLAGRQKPSVAGGMPACNTRQGSSRQSPVANCWVPAWLRTTGTQKNHNNYNCGRQQ